MYLITDKNCSILWKTNFQNLYKKIILHVYFFPVYVNDRGYDKRNAGS